MRKMLFFPIALLFGCFNPDLTAATLICDPGHFCPDGYSCIDGLCKPGTGGFQTGADGGIVDMTAPVVSGCSDGKGSDVSSSSTKPAWACSGTYQASTDGTKNADRLCAVGFAVCTMADTVSQNTCNNVSGFFLADVPVRFQNFNSSCGVPGGGQTPAWAGRGKSTSNVANISACGGFGKAMYDFNNTQLKINSPYTPLSTTTQNDSGTNGVLCCKK